MRSAYKIAGLLGIFFVMMLFSNFFPTNGAAAKSIFPLSWSDDYLQNSTKKTFKISNSLEDEEDSFWQEVKEKFTPKSPQTNIQKAYPIIISTCGNGQVDEGEECDGTQGLGTHQVCSDECRLVNLDYCGDGIVNLDEDCDDGNMENGDGCSSYCSYENMIVSQPLYDLGQLPSELLPISWPTLPTITNEARVSTVKQFNIAASQPWTRIRVEKNLEGDCSIAASDVEVVVDDGVKIDFLYVSSGVGRIRIIGGEYNELTIKSPVTFWPEYKINYDKVVEDIVIENVKVTSTGYYAFFGMARRMVVLNSSFYSESVSFTSESPDGLQGENYIIAGNQFYSKGPLANISIVGVNKLFFVDNLVDNHNAFNKVNIQIDQRSSFPYISRNTFIGTGISLSSDRSWVEENTFYHKNGALFDASLNGDRLTVIENTVYSDLTDCLVCGDAASNWTVFNNSIHAFKEPVLEENAYFEVQAASDSDLNTDAAIYVAEARPGGEQNDLRPFFIGHSLLNVSIPKMLDDIADSLGNNNVYAYDETYLTGSGASLRWNYNHPYDGQGADPFIELVQPNKYDALVLSDAIPAINFEEETKEFSYRFYQLGVEGNPQLDLFLLATWVHKDRLSFSKWSEALENETAVWERVRSYLVDKTGRSNIYIIPGGLALKRLVEEADAGRVPGLSSGNELFEEDLVHLNALGNYFISLVHFASLYRKNPIDATHITYSPWGGENRPAPDGEMARKMQEIAWEIVSNYPNSGVGAAVFESQCGNNSVEMEETCDDGNQIDGDGCSSVCELELNQNDNLVAKGENEAFEIQKTNQTVALDNVIGFSSSPKTEATEEKVKQRVIKKIGDINQALKEGRQKIKKIEKDIKDSEFMLTETLFPSAQIGLNLNWNYNNIQQWMFVDVMKHAQSWKTRSAEGWQGWDTEMENELEWQANGYPLEIPAETSQGPQIVYTVLLSNDQSTEGAWPAGRYNVYYTGDGDLAFGTDVVLVDQIAGQYTIEVPSGSYLELQIVRSKRSNPVRNIRVIMPGFEKSYLANPFHPLFLERLAGVSALRFANAGAVNYHPVTSWSDRATPEFYSQGTEKGVALEYLVQLSNLTRKNPWFNLPHAADDNYVKRYAKYLKNNLDSSLTIYLEYSNEVWNEAYGQSAWLRNYGCRNEDTFVAHSDGEDFGIKGCDDVVSGIKATAKRMAEVFKIVDEVFGEQSYRVVKVMGGRTDWYEYNDMLWGYFNDPVINPSQVAVNAFAIAPMFGRSQDLAKVLGSKNGAVLSVNDILEFAADDLETTVAGWLEYYAKWAQTNNLRLLAYESGNQLTFTAGGPEVAGKVEVASRHPRMGELYSQYIEKWKDVGGDLMMISNYIGLPGSGETRGLLEYQNQSLDEAYMYQAVMTAAGTQKTMAVCGDGVTEAWEKCDDGNKMDRDGCSQYCTVE